MNNINSLHDAAREGDLERIKALIKDNPDLVFSKDDNYGGTALHVAVDNGRKDLAELLLTSRAEVDPRGNNGVTPLHLAAWRGHKDIVELLLANKAEVNAKANNGWTPLRWAAANDHYGVAELLRQHGGHE